MVKRPDLVERNRLRRCKYPVTCKCGNVFFVVKSQLERRNYCSQKCYSKFGKKGNKYLSGHCWKLTDKRKKQLSENQKGSLNHNWKGGITNPRKNSESVMWSKRIKKRDGYCILCGCRKGLAAHHLEGFNINERLRYVDSNGVTLCEKHHNEFHKKYGLGNNTTEQFNEWLNKFFKPIDKIELFEVEVPYVYNLCLDGDDSFFANGILTHNTPNPTTKEEILDWVTKKIMPKIKVKSRKGMTKAMVANKIAENLAEHITKYGPRPYPFIRQTLKEDLPKILRKYQ